MEPILKTRQLSKYFDSKRASVGCIDINLDIFQGEIFCLVGESGCGKSTLAKCILGFHPPSSGSIWFKKTLKKGIDSRIQYIFQDPFSSLNPRMSIQEILEEPLILRQKKNRQARSQAIDEILPLVGLQRSQLPRHPHEFSGGQRQRIAIARALLMEPEFLICDEPTSSLDVSIQSQIIQLLLELKQQKKLTYLFISHDLRLVSHIADRVAVMKEGQIVECQTNEAFFKAPQHPYSKQLLDCSLPFPSFFVG